MIIRLFYSVLFLGCTFLFSCHYFQDKHNSPFDYSAKITAIKKEFSLEDEQRFKLFIRIFKEEELLEVWLRPSKYEPFQMLRSRPFCVNSGVLGPKRKEGDLQIPEGFYFINRFNWESQFYLSLGLNYPNKADLILGDPKTPGSDIFIHGGCASIGCISIEDNPIEELFALAYEAKDSGQIAIPVHIFPFKMFDQNCNEKFQQFPQHQTLWKQLRKGFSAFETNKGLFPYQISDDGIYTF